VLALKFLLHCGWLLRQIDDLVIHGANARDLFNCANYETRFVCFEGTAQRHPPLVNG
jgi:hypothetical protein